LKFLIIYFFFLHRYKNTREYYGRRESAVCVAGMDGHWAYTSHVLMPAISTPHWFYNNRFMGGIDRFDGAAISNVPRSISVPQPATVRI